MTNNFGYQLTFTYAGATSATVASVSGVNNAFLYCDPTSTSCGIDPKAWPTIQYAGPAGTPATVTVTDADGNATTFTYNASSELVGITRPGSSAQSTSIVFDSSGRVFSVTNGARIVTGRGSGPGVWQYYYQDNTPTTGPRTTTVSDPLGHTRGVVSSMTTSLVASDTDGNGHTTQYAYDTPYGRILTITRPLGVEHGGDTTTFSYDGRGNVIQTSVVPVQGSPLPNIVTSALYPAQGVCTDQTTTATQNLPCQTTDANGNKTNYTYKGDGQIKTIEPPQPAGSNQPETRFAYSQLQAWYYGAGGAWAAAPPVTLLTGISACALGIPATPPATPCAIGSADETRSTLAYQAGSLSPKTPSNLGLVSVTQAAGDGSLSSTSSQTFDDFGNVSTVTGPLGAGQTSAFFWDLNRNQTEVVGPYNGTHFPDRQTTYGPDNQPTVVASGYATSQTKPTGFAELEETDIGYDALGRTVQVSQANPGTPRRSTCSPNTPMTTPIAFSARRSG